MGAYKLKGQGGAKAWPTRKGLRLAKRSMSRATLHSG